MIPIKSASDLAAMRQAGSLLVRITDKLRGFIKAGISTLEIDRIAEELILKEGARPAFKGYLGFPASVCACLNEEVVHGIPSERRIKEGDILKLDIGINRNGYFSDYAFTLAIGNIEGRVKKLLEATKRALDLGVAQALPERHLSDISWAIQSYIEAQGFSVVRDFVGHGIGLKMHEPPEIPNFGRPGKGAILKEGMVLAIEPMVNMGGWEVKISDNGWTALTKDRLQSAHFEHTVAVTKDGPEILTKSN